MNKEMQRLLQPFPAPDKKLKVITMNLMFDLPKSEEHTGKMTVVDEPYKRTHFIRLTDQIKAPYIAH